MIADLTPEQLEYTKRLAKGPVGEFVNRIPLMFAMAALIAWRDENSQPVSIRNGSVTLLRIDGRQFGVTCHHVVQEYLDKRSAGFDTIFQIGNHKLNPVTRLVDSSEEFDLAVLDLNDWTEMRGTNPEIGCSFFDPREWPPKLPKVGNHVEIGGFPGVFREQTGNDGLDFGTWSVGKVPVMSMSETKLGIQFEREHWIELPGPKSGINLRTLGGISGGPVTIEWTLASGLWIVDLVGIAYEYSPDYDLLFARPTSLIRQNGTIKRRYEAI